MALPISEPTPDWPTLISLWAMAAMALLTVSLPPKSSGTIFLGDEIQTRIFSNLGVSGFRNLHAFREEWTQFAGAKKFLWPNRDDFSHAVIQNSKVVV
jgi:hypothetical protein